MSGFYLVIGILFTMLAIHYSRTDGLTGVWTIISMIVATFDFANSIRYFVLHRHFRKYKK